MPPGTLGGIQTLSRTIGRRRAFAFLATLRRRLPGAEIFLVGGAVRDAILRRETKDYDFVVRNVPAKTLEQTLKRLGRVNLVGRTFGVFKFVPRGLKIEEPFDLALPRTEHSAMTGGYRDVNVQSNPRLPIERDLERRDFTVNAIAWNVSKRQLVDPTNGLRDLRRKILKAVGDPHQRFREDALRLLRAIRLACQLGLDIEPKTWAAIRRDIRLLTKKHQNEFVVPRETVGRELIRAFVADPVRTLDLLDRSAAVRTLLPELLPMKRCPQPSNWHREGDVWRHTRLALTRLGDRGYRRWFGGERPSALVVLGTLFHDVGKPATITKPKPGSGDRIRFNDHDKVGAEITRRVAEQLKFSVFPKDDPMHHVDPDHLAWIVRHHLAGYRNEIDVMRQTTVEKYFCHPVFPSDALLKVQYADTAATIHDGDLPDFSNLRKVMARVRSIRRLAGKRPRVSPILNGHEIMKSLRLAPGPEVGKVMERLREAQLTGKVKTKAEAKRYLAAHPLIRPAAKTLTVTR